MKRIQSKTQAEKAVKKTETEEDDSEEEE